MRHTITREQFRKLIRGESVVIGAFEVELELCLEDIGVDAIHDDVQEMVKEWSDVRSYRAIEAYLTQQLS